MSALVVLAFLLLTHVCMFETCRKSRESGTTTGSKERRDGSDRDGKICANHLRRSEQAWYQVLTG